MASFHPLICRLQKEKEDALADIDCKREQYDKLQVSSKSLLTLRHAARQLRLMYWPDHLIFHLSLSIFGPFDRAKVERNIALQRKDEIFLSCKMRQSSKTWRNRTYHKSACGIIEDVETFGEIFSGGQKSWDYSFVMSCLYWWGLAMARPKCEAITELHRDTWIAFLQSCTSHNWSSCFLYQIDTGHWHSVVLIFAVS